jgi:hypothetical protein
MNKESTSKTLDNLKWLFALAVFAFAVVGNSYFIEIAFLYRVIGVLGSIYNWSRHNCSYKLWIKCNKTHERIKN